MKANNVQNIKKIFNLLQNIHGFIMLEDEWIKENKLNYKHFREGKLEDKNFTDKGFLLRRLLYLDMLNYAEIAKKFLNAFNEKIKKDSFVDKEKLKRWRTLRNGEILTRLEINRIWLNMPIKEFKEYNDLTLRTDDILVEKSKCIMHEIDYFAQFI